MTHLRIRPQRHNHFLPGLKTENTTASSIGMPNASIPAPSSAACKKNTTPPITLKWAGNENIKKRVVLPSGQEATALPVIKMANRVE